MKKIVSLCLAALAASLAPLAVRADVLIFDSYNGAGNFTTRGAQSSPGSEITASADTSISSIAVLMDLNAGGAAGNLEFLIFSNTGTLLYESAAQNFADDGLTYKKSAPFSFTLRAGQTYEIGAISDTAGFWAYDNAGATQGNLSSDSTNPNFANYAAPTVNVRSGNADGAVRLYAVPESSTWALLGLGVAGMGVVMRRRRTAA